MTLDEAQLFIAKNNSLIGKEMECGFVCGALWILPIEQPGLDNCIKYYTNGHFTESIALPINYEGEVGIIAVDVRYLRSHGAFIYKIITE